ncbi:DedA family protein, partial [Halomonas sp. 707D7]|uniref:DedA family protein n=1 Tax=Halomonas sp. 707D7 TaxID=1681044 RepID=UPI00209FF16D
SARVHRIQQSAAGARVLKTFDARPDLFAFSFRFAYGLRIASAVTIGTARFPWSRFVMLNALSALAWAVVWVTLGYACGQAIEGLFGRLNNVPHFALACVVIGVCIALLAVVVSKRRGRRSVPMAERRAIDET